MRGVLKKNNKYDVHTAKNIIRKRKKTKNQALSAGFEPAREDPNGFLVHRLNHSATTTFLFDIFSYQRLHELGRRKNTNLANASTSSNYFTVSTSPVWSSG